MILQALKGYYDRKEKEGQIARDGWIKGGLDFLLDLNEQGEITGISDLREQQGKRKISKPIDLPSIGKQSLKHTNSGKDANLLWDNASFIFGLGTKGDIRLESMIAAIDHWLEGVEDPGVKAVRAFLKKGLHDRGHFAEVLNHPEYGEDFNIGSVKISFRVPHSGYNTVFESPDVIKSLEDSINNADADDKLLGTCLVTGEVNTALETTHPVTKGVWGAQTSGACVVSFNKDAFNSYGKSQSLNAPVSKRVVSQYGKALNALLNTPEQCLHIGDSTVVFWSEEKTEFEEAFSLYFKESAKDDPDRKTEIIRELYDSVNTGAFLENTGSVKFYVLGLAPNSARIAIRFWHVNTIQELAKRIKLHFDDLEIEKPDAEPLYYSLWRILVNIATQDQSANIPPNLAGDFMRTILDGKPYPATMLQAVLRRIRSDTSYRVKPVRAALIKAYLNRYYRFYPHQNIKEVNVKLDTSQPSIGYQLGRLFAVLEKIQEEANPGLNTTIRERYYGAACATPVTVFTNLLRLKNHHLAKLEHQGRVMYFEKMLGDIVSKLSDFPPHLNLHEQGRFAIGYYHQRQDLFKKKEKVEPEFAQQ